MSWSTSELRMRLAPWNRFKPSIKIFFTDRSKAVLLLWIFNAFFCLVFDMPLCASGFFVPCGHQLGNGWPLGSRLWCLTVSLSLSNWYPGTGVVLDCIDSWSLHPYLHSSKCHQLNKTFSVQNVDWGMPLSFLYKAHVNIKWKLGSWQGFIREKNVVNDFTY